MKISEKGSQNSVFESLFSEIGDTPYDALPFELKSALTEYYRLDSLEDYDQIRIFGI
ncbi:MAG: hypothetical protein LUD12_09125 [Lachnospiraceae bacterium]|nr:hypothetical protein [Lachnospiraceae bacterium]